MKKLVPILENYRAKWTPEDEPMPGTILERTWGDNWAPVNRPKFGFVVVDDEGEGEGE